MTGDYFQGGLLEAPLYPLKPGVSRGPPGLLGGPGPLVIRPLKLRVDNRGSNGTGCFRIKARTDTVELKDMRIAGLKVMRSDLRR